ncbi:hypothetical protein [Kribbella sp. HUAS MG21]|uniref:Uncharacterized protein n=1 Tax=Kribbella sp. HUAS MG21 TaxID=3160966 RepID=A0AAU7T637_9ACTN
MGEHDGAVPGIAPEPERVGVARRLHVDGEVFEVWSGGGGTQYDWVSGPNAGYGFAVSPVAGSDEEHERNIRGFLSMVDPATGYIAED